MHVLEVKLLAEGAKAPTVANPKEDIGYDLYSLEDAILPADGSVVKVRTGIAAHAKGGTGTSYGLLIRDRSSMAARGICTHGGVIDAGYRGEIIVLMSTGPALMRLLSAFYASRVLHAETEHEFERKMEELMAEHSYRIKAGDKVAQMIPMNVLTDSVLAVEHLEEAARGSRGFGSSGR